MISRSPLPIMLIAILMLSISGCATTGDEQHIESQEKDAVTINGTSSHYGFQKWTRLSLYSVNGKIVPLGLISDPVTTKLTAGKSTIVVRARYNDGGNGPFITLVPMEVKLLPGTTYELHGNVTGSTVEAWLTQASTQEKASNSFFASERESLAPFNVMKIRLK